MSKNPHNLTDYTTETDMDVTNQFAGEIDILQALTGNDRDTCAREMIQRVRRMSVTPHQKILINANVKGVGDHLRRVLGMADHLENFLDQQEAPAQS